MAETTLEDRRDRLFGRDADLVALRARAAECGLTAIVAQPQMGKSWLMMELARGLDETPGWLVGVAESHGETPDLLLRAIVDLYERWLANTDRRHRALMVWEQQKTNLLPAFAAAFGKIAGELPHVGKLAGGLIKTALDGLVGANQTLATGGITLPTLQYAQAQDLVSSVAQISGFRIAIILDQWEKTPSPGLEANTLDSFLRHWADWSACHIFIALRPDDGARKVVDALASDHARARVYELQPMNLDAADERSRLIRFLRNEIPAAKHTSDDRLLELLQGYPRVIDRWVDDRDKMQDEDDLLARAKDANVYRYRDFEKRLLGLADDARSLATRLALVPMTADQNAWRMLREPVLGTTRASLLDTLAASKVLDRSSPPSFGHATRWEAARSYLLDVYPNLVDEEAQNLIERLSSLITESDIRFAPLLIALVELPRAARGRELDPMSIALCQAAATLLGAHIEPSGLLASARAVRTEGRAKLASLLALGLFNALTTALQRSRPSDVYVTADELTALAARFSRQSAVRKAVAGGLHNALTFAFQNDSPALANTLLDQLRHFQSAYPSDKSLRSALAPALYNRILGARFRGDVVLRDTSLRELSNLSEANRVDSVVREFLAKSLFDILNDLSAQRDFVRRDESLQKLRSLNAQWPEDQNVRRLLAKALYNTLLDAKNDNNAERSAALLGELRSLADRGPGDRDVRDILAKAESGY